MHYKIRKHYRFDEVTADTAKRKSEKLRMSESEFIRELILCNSEAGKYILLRRDLKKIMDELSYIGEGINHIAHKSNMMILHNGDIKVIEVYANIIHNMRTALIDKINRIKNDDV